jgi:hypothetical protein
LQDYQHIYGLTNKGPMKFNLLFFLILSATLSSYGMEEKQTEVFTTPSSKVVKELQETKHKIETMKSIENPTDNADIQELKSKIEALKGETISIIDKQISHEKSNVPQEGRKHITPHEKATPDGTATAPEKKINNRACAGASIGLASAVAIIYWLVNSNS